ncbi:hypothetical protein ACP70R_027765 [Stipagrostis hirtigluma subsp. patula]
MSTMAKLVVAMLLVLVATSSSATRAAARALPGDRYDAEQPAAAPSSGGFTSMAVPSPTRSSAQWRGLHGIPLLVEKKSGAGHSCGSHDVNIGCP